MKRHYGRACTVLIVLAGTLAGCASTGPAPVEDRSGGAHRNEPREIAPRRADRYRVERGDTLYSIAFRHGLDYRDLAAWNGIGAPYTIYPGDELRLEPGPAPRRVVAAAPSPPARPPPPPPAPARFETVPPKAAVASTAPAPAPAPAAAPPPAPVEKPAPPPAASVANVGDVAWRWPADGQIVATYASNDPLRQGVDIAGAAGSPVRAAANGVVVYSGNGLIGYGELIIVKHSPTFLSAYGHNRKRLVQEGDRVSAGQTIAEMGSSGASRDELHFEIRKNGKPVDPLGFLPRR